MQHGSQLMCPTVAEQLQCTSLVGQHVSVSSRAPQKVTSSLAPRQGMVAQLFLWLGATERIADSEPTLTDLVCTQVSGFPAAAALQQPHQQHGAAAGSSRPAATNGAAGLCGRPRQAGCALQ